MFRTGRVFSTQRLGAPNEKWGANSAARVRPAACGVMDATWDLRLGETAGGEGGFSFARETED